jgi:hypothetical protein
MDNYESRDQTLIIDEELSKQLWQVPIPENIIRDTTISNGAFRLYCDLLAYARTKTTCFPSRITLANDINCSERYIDKLKIELQEHGLLDWTQGKWSDGRLHNTYTLLAYKPIQKSDRENPSSRVAGTPVLVKYTNGKNTKGIMEHAHNPSKKRKLNLSPEQQEFLNRFKEAHLLVKKTAYNPIGPDWGALQGTSVETIKEILRIDDFYLNRGSRPLLKRWLEDHQGDWEDSTAKNIAVLLKQDVLDRFLHEHQKVAGGTK